MTLEQIIDEAWERRDELSARSDGKHRAAVLEAVGGLDDGRFRVSAPDEDGGWRTNEWLKKAVLLYFRLNDMSLIEGGPGGATWFDKVPLKFEHWNESAFRTAGFRAVPGAIVRRGAHIGKGAVLMPSFVNIGAHIASGAMIDTWASIGSCAQIGANCHISAGAGIGGVLEPLQASPTIVEDDCFIGARSEVVEGVVVGRGSVIGMGVFITASTKIVDRTSGEITRGAVPPFSVVVPGSLPGAGGAPSLACAVIVKRVDEGTRAKTSINELLRE